MTDHQAPDQESVDAAMQAMPGRSLLSRAKGLLTHPHAPMVAGVLVIGLLGLVVLNKLAPSVLPSVGLGPRVVVFDPVRFVNAQRAAASIMAVTPNADMALTLTQVAKQAEAVIKDEAHGAIVLVRQAVVAPGELTDITERVLERFGLPTAVPTVTTNAGALALETIAPTDSAFSPGKLREDYRMELERKSLAADAARAKTDGQNNIVP